jgi:hypothetical protein
MEQWWDEVAGDSLAQGDLFRACLVPIIPDDFSPSPVDQEAGAFVGVQAADLIVVTQTCDLEQNKAPRVVACPVSGRSEFEEVNPRTRTRWDEVRKGRVEGLCLLRAPAATNPTDVVVVEFRSVFSLPIGYFRSQAQRTDRRYRLKSPYVEHFSQSFARLFMRVALPSEIPQLR